jgi:hypothetical protein
MAPEFDPGGFLDALSGQLQRLMGDVQSGDEVLGKGIYVGRPAFAHALGQVIRVLPLHVDQINFATGHRLITD